MKRRVGVACGQQCVGVERTAQRTASAERSRRRSGTHSTSTAAHAACVAQHTLLQWTRPPHAAARAATLHSGTPGLPARGTFTPEWWTSLRPLHVGGRPRAHIFMIRKNKQVFDFTGWGQGVGRKVEGLPPEACGSRRRAQQIKNCGRWRSRRALWQGAQRSGAFVTNKKSQVAEAQPQRALGQDPQK